MKVRTGVRTHLVDSSSLGLDPLIVTNDLGLAEAVVWVDKDASYGFRVHSGRSKTHLCYAVFRRGSGVCCFPSRARNRASTSSEFMMVSYRAWCLGIEGFELRQQLVVSG
jgi:hypothetical protein